MIKVIKSEINLYILFVITAFLSVTFLMQPSSIRISLEGFWFTLPIIVLIVFWCKNSSFLIKKNDIELNNYEIFKRDLFLIFYSVISADFIYLIFQYNNIDRGWWPLSVYCLSFYGFIISVLFSFTTLIIKNHKMYTIVASWVIFFTMLFCSFCHKKVYVLFIGAFDSYIFIMMVLILLHMLICFAYIFYNKINLSSFI